MRLPRLSLVVAAVVLCASLSAHASTMTDLVTFTSSGAVTASGSFTLTFDPTQNYTDATTGFIVNSIAYPGTPPTSIGFDYTVSGGSDGPNELIIGGVNSGVDTVSGATNDFALYITNFTTSPTFDYFVYTTMFSSPVGAEDGTVTVTNEGTVTPEPSSFLLLGTGLVGAFAAARRKMFVPRS